MARAEQVLAATDERGVRLLHVQAAVELAAPELLPVLADIATTWAGDDELDDGEHHVRLRRALRRSTPDAAGLALRLERGLVDGVNKGVADPERASYVTGQYPRTTLHFRTEHLGTGWWRRLWQDGDPDTYDLALEIDNWIFNAPSALNWSHGSTPGRSVNVTALSS